MLHTKREFKIFYLSLFNSLLNLALALLLLGNTLVEGFFIGIDDRRPYGPPDGEWQL